MTTIKLNQENKDWIDYSSLSSFLKCPRLFYWTYIRNIKSTNDLPLINGKAYHEACAVYTSQKIAGIPHDKAVKLAIEEGMKIMDTITIEDKIRNKSVYTETMLNYFSYYKNDSNIPIDVEIGFAFKFGNILFVGRIDEYCQTPLGKMVKEIKTTSIVGKRWNDRVNPSLQIDTYYSAIYIITGDIPYGGMYDIIPLHENPFKREKPFRVIGAKSLETIDTWLKNVQMTLKFIEICKDNNFYPQNTESCVPLTGYKCDFITLCHMYPKPFKLSEIEIPSLYKYEPWYPFEELNIKGDIKCL